MATIDDGATKSTVEDIQRRFDNDVDRFASLDTGQRSTVDAPLVLNLTARAAASVNPTATRVLDIGCGAGNYTLKLLQHLPGLDVDLVDLSQPMLDCAVERVGDATSGRVRPIQANIRELSLDAERYDIIVAAAVLHHLRTDAEWEGVFAKLYDALKPDGSFWVSDLIEHSTEAIQELMWQRYGEYLTNLGGAAYRDRVFGYIEREDTPRPLMEQIDLLRAVGFQTVEILHKNSNFAAFGALK